MNKIIINIYDFNMEIRYYEVLEYINRLKEADEMENGLYTDDKKKPIYGLLRLVVQ
jgi:hypothetical protein